MKNGKPTARGHVEWTSRLVARDGRHGYDMASGVFVKTLADGNLFVEDFFDIPTLTVEDLANTEIVARVRAKQKKGKKGKKENRKSTSSAL